MPSAAKSITSVPVISAMSFAVLPQFPIFRGLKLMITRIFSAFRRWSDSTCDNFTISEKKMQ